MGFRTQLAFGKNRAKFFENYQNRMSAKKLVKGTKHLRLLIYHNIPEEIKEKHLVKQGIKSEHEAEKELEMEVKAGQIIFRNLLDRKSVV